VARRPIGRPASGRDRAEQLQTGKHPWDELGRGGYRHSPFVADFLREVRLDRVEPVGWFSLFLHVWEPVLCLVCH